MCLQLQHHIAKQNKTDALKYVLTTFLPSRHYNKNKMYPNICK